MYIVAQMLGAALASGIVYGVTDGDKLGLNKVSKLIFSICAETPVSDCSVYIITWVAYVVPVFRSSLK